MPLHLWNSDIREGKKKLRPEQFSAFCLKQNGDRLVLKTTHCYYYLVQMQLAVTDFELV